MKHFWQLFFLFSPLSLFSIQEFFLQTEYRLSKSPSRVSLGETITLKGEFSQINNKHVKTAENLFANYAHAAEFKADIRTPLLTQKKVKTEMKIFIEGK